MITKIRRGPDFIGIGVMRAASTWIYNCLKEHPEICVSLKKELNFFNESYNYHKGIKHYQSFFEHCPEDKITGEFTPAYLYHPKTPYLIHKHYPNIKLIVCLRNPVNRAYSHYRFDVLKRNVLYIYDTFEEAVKKNQPLIARGFYSKQLQRYFDLFPRKNILILFFEDINKDPVQFIQRIYHFLNLKNPNFIPSILYQKKTKVRIVKEFKIPFFNKIIYKYITQTGGEIRRLEGKNWLEKVLDKIRLKVYIEKIVRYNKKFINIDKNYASIPPINENVRNYILNKVYKKDINQLEKLLEKDLSFWI